jgi:hypothetical protein
VFPVTVIDANRQIHCGGLFQFGLQTTEVFVWTLDITLSCIGKSWKVLFTDEDSALMTAISAFRQERNHEIIH